MPSTQKRYIQIIESLFKAGVGCRMILYAEKNHNRGDGIFRTCIVVLFHGGNNMEERFLKLHNVVASSLAQGEHMEYRYSSMILIGNGYEISIVVEAYNKRPSRIIFFNELGQVEIGFLNRISTWDSTKRARALTADRNLKWSWDIEKSEFAQYLDEPSLIEEFPNTADRFAFVAVRETRKSPIPYKKLVRYM